MPNRDLVEMFGGTPPCISDLYLKSNVYYSGGRYAREAAGDIHPGLAEEHSSILTSRTCSSIAILFYSDPAPCHPRCLLSLQLYLPTYRSLPTAAARARYERRTYVIQHAVQ